MDVVALERLLELSRQMAESRSLDPVLEKSVDFALQLFNAEYGYVVLLESDGSLSYRLKRTASGLSPTEMEIAISQSIAAEVASTRRAVITADAITDPRVSKADSVRNLHLRSVMCSPLIVHDKLIGALYVENRSRTSLFTEEDLRLLGYFASQAAVAIENARLNTQLEERVTERTDALERMNAQLALEIEDRMRLQNEMVQRAVEQEQMQLLSTFVQDTAHQFRTPLSVIRLNVDLLRRMIQSEAIRSRLDSISEQSESILALVESLTLMVRLDSSPAIRLRPIDLRMIVEHASEETSSRASRKGHVFDLQLPEVPVSVDGDIELLIVMVCEIIDNAIRFTPDNGHITIHLFEESPYVGIAVRDDGIGIAPEHIPSIFDRFYRVDTSGHTLGFGLGLTIASKIMEAHSGHIDVISAPGEGSIFRLRFPIAFSEAAPGT